MAEGETRGAHATLSLSAPEPASAFWFVRPFLRWGASDWVGAILLTVVAYGGFTLLDWLVSGTLAGFETLYLPFHLVYFGLTAVFLGRESERIWAYAESLGATGTERIRRTLYGARWPLVVALPIEAVYLVPLLTAPGFTFADFFRQAAPLGIFHILVGATGVWAFAYSMWSLRLIGRAPLALKPFTEDASLGLRPFGSSALRLVGIFESAILVAAAPMMFESASSVTSLPTFAVLGFAGLILFFLPLWTFRRQMREAKRQELGWIGPRYAELVQAVRESRGSHIDEEIVGSLSALDKIRRDVNDIHTWPFDEAIVARLASLTVLPLGVAVVARAVMILVLNV